MAQKQSHKNSTDEDAREKFLVPVTLLFRSFWVFLDVVTLMPRMLWNTLVHDTPHGKSEPSIEAREARRSR